MSQKVSRRSVLKGGATMASLAAIGLMEWGMPALAQGEEVIAFTDLPGQLHNGWTWWAFSGHADSASVGIHHTR